MSTKTANNETKVSVMDSAMDYGKRKINNEFTVVTNLVGRTEAFKLVALAETVNLPLLFLGVPGIGKTNVVRDYANSRIVDGGKLFILETDEYTRPAELKGRPNMEKLAHPTNPKYEVVSPIADADYIIINEIDKASGGLRNGLLSIMNEKVLFNGVEEVKLPYKVFVATCNEIPKDERNSPFWDRFILKATLSRMANDQIMTYFRNGHKAYKEEIKMKLPTAEEMKAGRKISEMKMGKLVDACYPHCSDRTLSFLPILVKAVAQIWNISADNAFIKTAEILVGPTVAKTLSDQITSKEMKGIMDKIDMIPGIKDVDSLKQIVHEITVLVTNYAKDGKLNPDQITEVEDGLTSVLAEKGVDIADLRKKV